MKSKENTPELTRTVISSPERGWRQFDHKGARVTWVGHLYSSSIEVELARHVILDPDDLVRAVNSWIGCFGLIYETPNWTVALTDPIRSYSIAYGNTESGVCIGPDPAAVARFCRLDRWDSTQCTVFAMSGFTLAGGTLIQGLHELTCGSALIVKGSKVRHQVYHCYQPKPDVSGAQEGADPALTAVLERMFSRLAADAGDRTVIVPLSAGLDSRLILTGLLEAGVRSIKTFAYGLPGNYEAKASAEIAKRLGVEWTFVPQTPQTQKKWFRSAQDHAYRAMAETMANVPFQQDLPAVLELSKNRYVPDDALFVNGQSGDFITGGHIPLDLVQHPEVAFLDVVNQLVGKHYSLWADLKNPQALELIEQCLRKDFEDAGIDLSGGAPAWSLYETSEYRNRQVKYVVSGQRIYEFAGYDWRLPLWDRDFVDFWEHIDPCDKVGQALYRRTLQSLNWGKVWQGVDFPRFISPNWIRPVREAAKVFFVLRDRHHWQDFDRRWFAYWMDVPANYAVTPFATVRNDKRGHRNAISWCVQDYMVGIGLNAQMGPSL